MKKSICILLLGALFFSLAATADDTAPKSNLEILLELNSQSIKAESDRDIEWEKRNILQELINDIYFEKTDSQSSDLYPNLEKFILASIDTVQKKLHYRNEDVAQLRGLIQTLVLEGYVNIDELPESIVARGSVEGPEYHSDVNQVSKLKSEKASLVFKLKTNVATRRASIAVIKELNKIIGSGSLEKYEAEFAQDLIFQIQISDRKLGIEHTNIMKQANTINSEISILTEQVNNGIYECTVENKDGTKVTELSLDAKKLAAGQVTSWSFSSSGGMLQYRAIEQCSELEEVPNAKDSLKTKGCLSVGKYDNEQSVSLNLSIGGSGTREETDLATGNKKKINFSTYLKSQSQRVTWGTESVSMAVESEEHGLKFTANCKFRTK